MEFLDNFNIVEEYKEPEESHVSSLVDNSQKMRMKIKSSEYIEIDYAEFALFLKKQLGRTFTKNKAKQFAEDLRKFLGLITEKEKSE